MFKSVNRFTGKLRSRSLQRQMMMLFTIMLVIPILLVSYFSYSSAKRELSLKCRKPRIPV